MAGAWPSEKMISARPNCRAENIVIQLIVISELEFCEMEPKIFGADLVERSDHAALNQRPEAFDGLGVDRADNILAVGVINRVVREVTAKTAIGDPLIRAKQADFLLDSLPHEALERRRASISDHTGDDVPFTPNGAHNDFFARTTSSAIVAALVDVPVPGFATDEGLINLHNPNQLLKAFVRQSGANPMAHMPSGPVGAEAHNALDLKCGNTLFAGHHHMNDAEPFAQGLISVLEECPCNVGEAISTALAAIRTFPLKRHRRESVNPNGTATWAVNTIWPAVRYQIDSARIIIREHLFELRDGHLMDAHAGLSVSMGAS
jgi:hypothetical protein